MGLTWGGSYGRLFAPRPRGSSDGHQGSPTSLVEREPVLLKGRFPLVLRVSPRCSQRRQRPRVGRLTRKP